MNKRLRQLLFLISYGIILSAVLTNLCTVLSFVENVLKLFIPVFAGLVIAFVLNVPMKGFENILRRLLKKTKFNIKDRTIDIVCLILTLSSASLILILVYTMMVPELLYSIKSLCNIIKDRWPDWMALLNSYGINTDTLSQWVNSSAFNGVIKTVTGSATTFINSLANMSASILSAVVTTLFAFVIAIYMLIDKKEFATQSKKIIYANFKDSCADNICHIASVFQQVYAKFLSGQCIEAVILGLMVFVSFTVFKLPYASLIAVLASVFAFIPYIGAYVVCALGAIFTFIASPSQTLLCIIVYLVVQFIETQFIYPKVVGSSVGLSPLFTLLAALIGGKLFGLFGIIFFIPLVAAINELIKENTENKLEHKDVL